MERLESRARAIQSIAEANAGNIDFAIYLVQEVYWGATMAETIHSLVEIFQITHADDLQSIKVQQVFRRLVLKDHFRILSLLSICESRLLEIQELLTEYTALSQRHLEKSKTLSNSLLDKWPKSAQAGQRIVVHQEIMSKSDSKAVQGALSKIGNALTLSSEVRTRLKGGIVPLHETIEQGDDIMWGLLPP
jgi:hypothetical protein